MGSQQDKSKQKLSISFSEMLLHLSKPLGTIPPRHDKGVPPGMNTVIIDRGGMQSSSYI